MYMVSLEISDFILQCLIVNSVICVYGTVYEMLDMFFDRSASINHVAFR